MAGGSTNSTTNQDNGIDITTNADAGSINNYANLKVDGSTSTTGATATGSTTGVKLAYSGPVPALQNLYEMTLQELAGATAGTTTMYHVKHDVCYQS